MATISISAIRKELNGRKGQWPTICEETGLGYSWLQKFAQGRYRNPGFDRIMILAGHLFPDEEYQSPKNNQSAA